MKLRSLLAAVAVSIFLTPVTLVANSNAALAPTASADDQKDSFADSAKKDIDRYEDSLSQLKRERNATVKDSAQYRDLETKVNSLEAKLRETKDNLKALKSANSATWTRYQAKVNDNLSELRSIAGRAE